MPWSIQVFREGAFTILGQGIPGVGPAGKPEGGGAARWQQGERVEAGAWLAGEGVVEAEKMVGMLAPGFLG